MYHFFFALSIYRILQSKYFNGKLKSIIEATPSAGTPRVVSKIHFPGLHNTQAYIPNSEFLKVAAFGTRCGPGRIRCACGQLKRRI